MKRTYTAAQLAAAHDIFTYLALRSIPQGKADVIIGFGHFDLNIPRHCGTLYHQGSAPAIIFTGGIGSGTADLGQPEARAFLAEVTRCVPTVPESVIFIEERSTNTSENIRFTIQMLKDLKPPRLFGEQIQSAILVANAYRQRRVLLTCQKHLPDILFYNAPPDTTFERELRMFADKGFDFIDLLVGEIERLIRYAEHGFIVQETLPENIYCGYRQLADTMRNEKTYASTSTPL